MVLEIPKNSHRPFPNTVRPQAYSCTESSHQQHLHFLRPSAWPLGHLYPPTFCIPWLRDPPASPCSQYTPSPTLLVRLSPLKSNQAVRVTIFLKRKAGIKCLVCGPKFSFLGHRSLSPRTLELKETLAVIQIISHDKSPLLAWCATLLLLLGCYHGEEGLPSASHWQET